MRLTHEQESFTCEQEGNECLSQTSSSGILGRLLGSSGDFWGTTIVLDGAFGVLSRDFWVLLGTFSVLEGTIGVLSRAFWVLRGIFGVLREILGSSGELLGSS